DRGSAVMVDLRRGLPDEAKTIDLPLGRSADVVRVLPDQATVLFSADRHIVAFNVPQRPALDRVSKSEAYQWDYFLPGNLGVSTDGRTLLLDVGRVLSVSR